ncbi:Zn-dependent hydrolase [Roseinatronobacter sp. S2]|uniref:Zn-dependent hydrolase n=1 Tax=Roseinatronobacter sp. S2 TaxID=3035471 RepID=UPI0024105247|nr:Zn-dependent hydrolase [Roseinatronobacter sp. S2]WFE74734.1 Zn-dependent hydrolase [Roseinatronobacter sp. S2]
MNAAEPDTLSLLAQKIFDDLRAMSPDGAGVSRPAYSSIETRALDYLSDVARAHGLAVDHDAAGNGWFCLPEHRDADRFMVVGSHIDSVPEGGNFDGLAGVVAGLLVLIRAQGRGLRIPVKCLALRGEESAWFGSCYLGSKALTGQMTATELAAPHKADGRPLADHMADLGIDTAAIAAGQSLIAPDRIAGYVELHIEQGPLLVERDIPAAVVTGIRGNIRYRAITCTGEGGHSGAVPRVYRRDPVLAMADLLTRLDDSWLHILQTGGDLVLTSGVVGTDPARHAITRIADSISFSLDIRSQSTEVLAHMRDYLHEEMADIARVRSVSFDTGPEIPAAPALMDKTMVRDLMEAMRSTGIEPFSMASGAGHDAAVFAQAGVPAAMIFVRNRNGSHNPREAMEIADFMVGTRIISAYLEALQP